MTQWEYKTLSVSKRMVSLGLQNLNAQLAELGGEGWELVAVDSLSKKLSLYVFRRPMFDEDYDEEDYDDEDYDTAEEDEDYDEDYDDEDADELAEEDEEFDDDEYDEDGSIRL